MRNTPLLPFIYHCTHPFTRPLIGSRLSVALIRRADHRIDVALHLVIRCRKIVFPSHIPPLFERGCLPISGGYLHDSSSVGDPSLAITDTHCTGCARALLRSMWLCRGFNNIGESPSDCLPAPDTNVTGKVRIVVTPITMQALLMVCVTFISSLFSDVIVVLLLTAWCKSWAD